MSLCEQSPIRALLAGIASAIAPAIVHGPNLLDVIVDIINCDLEKQPRIVEAIYMF